MEIDKYYNVQVYGFAPRKIKAKYIGKTQEKTAIQNEVHGFRCSHGVLLCTKDDLTKRISS